MSWIRFPETVVYEDRIEAKHSRWGQDAVLFQVHNGTRKLGNRYGADRTGQPHRFLLLDGKPLSDSSGDAIYCPTCEKLLSLGLGREQVDEEFIRTIQCSQTDHSSDIAHAFEKAKPMLSMLDDGYYLITRILMVPTDGEGRFFWNLSTSKKRYPAAADVYYKYHYSNGTPKFLLPSQGTGCLNEERIDYYLEQIRNGQTMTGLALYNDGFMSTLLDGHHRAAAAYAANTYVDCLTIIPVTAFQIDQDHKPSRLFAGGEAYDSALFKQPDRIYKSLKKHNDPGLCFLTVDDVEQILAECKEEHDPELSLNRYSGMKSYPDYLSVAFADLAGDDISEERINAIFSAYDEDAEIELEMLFKKLQMEETERAFELAFRIALEPNWRMLLEDSFRYLAAFDREEVEDHFIHYVIHTEFDSKDSCRKIADKYLNSR
ncbi:hypothetical protein [Paenibacillus humicus]|uniref:hypothetical protein n=1 Tax=Paenibacillus humicus TaxID=412861 RepID=UPI000FD6D959|nr:hypothetical protein [Paenibacillus humicus]